MYKIIVEVIFENGDKLITAINGNFEYAKEYYLNKYFNLGVTSDSLQRCIKIELIEILK